MSVWGATAVLGVWLASLAWSALLASPLPLAPRPATTVTGPGTRPSNLGPAVRSAARHVVGNTANAGE